MGLLSFGSKDIGIDLGTSSILVTVMGRGIALREPTVVATDIKTEKILATGREAKNMIGKTPESINAVKPLKEGVIADYTATRLLLRNILKEVSRRSKSRKPRAVVGVPNGITEVEERAVQEAVIYAGAREVYLVDEPLLAAIGIGIHIEEPRGSMIVDLGAGITDVVVISLGGVVVGSSIRIAGDRLDEDIINYLKKTQNLSVGVTTAEQIKKEIGCATPLITELTMEVKGRDLATGLPRTIEVSSSQILEALKESLSKIVDTIKQTLEKTPPELAADLIERGIVLTGGGAMLKNIDKLISDSTKMPVYVVDEPLESVVRGAGAVLRELDRLKPALINKRKRNKKAKPIEM